MSIFFNLKRASIMTSDGLWMEAPRLPLEDFGVEVPEPVEEDSEEESSSGNERYHPSRSQRACEVGRLRL